MFHKLVFFIFFQKYISTSLFQENSQSDISTAEKTTFKVPLIYGESGVGKFNWKGTTSRSIIRNTMSILIQT
mgnify:CR=1 FL=1